MNKNLFFEIKNWWENGTFLDWGVQYGIIRPWLWVKPIKRKILWSWQRLTRGWDDQVIWGIDYYLAKFMPIWIRQLKKKKKGVPAIFISENEEDSIDEKHKQFQLILEKIAVGFESYEKMLEVDYYSKEHEELEKKFNEGIYLFLKYFSYLGY